MPGSAMPVGHAQQPTSGHRCVGTFDLNQRVFTEGSFGYTAVGEQVGLAQRMESAAPAGGVMLSASTARLVEGAARVIDPLVKTSIY
jgi:hypothetical protein